MRFNDGDLVVGRNQFDELFVGTYHYRGPQYQTVEVRCGCSVILQYEKDLERYNEYDFIVTKRKR